MQVGDLVIRKVNVAAWKEARAQRNRMGHGIVLKKQMSGRPEHPCVSVYYSNVGKVYDIAESLLEVVSEVGSKKN